MVLSDHSDHNGIDAFVINHIATVTHNFADLIGIDANIIEI